jgi:transcription initiation factor TFIIB
MSELDRLCDRLKIPHDLQELASKIYRKALKENLIRGRSIASIVAASLYLALRRANVPRSLKEISEVSTRNKKEIARCYRQLFWRLGYPSTIDDPIHYVTKIATKANISNKAQNEAIDLLQKGKRMNVTIGKDPSGVAGAALYIACVKNSERVTQKKIAEASGVTEVTIRNRYKSLVKDMNLKLNKSKYTLF